MIPRKCQICRHAVPKSGHCTRLDRPCSDAQSDDLYDPCGVSRSEGTTWEVERKKERKKKGRDEDA